MLLGACDVIQDGRHSKRHLRSYRKLEIFKKRQKLENFDAGLDNILGIFHLSRVKNGGIPHPHPPIVRPRVNKEVIYIGTFQNEVIWGNSDEHLGRLRWRLLGLWL